MKKINAVIGALSLLFYINSSNATPVSGVANISQTCFGIPISVNCTMNMDMTIVDTTMVDISITSASATGGGGFIRCEDFSFSNFPWTGSIAHSSLPTSPPYTAAFTLGTLQISTPCGGCSGSVTGIYDTMTQTVPSFSGALPGSPSCNINVTGIN
jgi:hypothetical protein